MTLVLRNHDMHRDLIYCQRLRRSATGRTAAYHVGTRRRHLFLFHNGQVRLSPSSTYFDLLRICCQRVVQQAAQQVHNKSKQCSFGFNTVSETGREWLLPCNSGSLICSGDKKNVVLTNRRFFTVYRRVVA